MHERTGPREITTLQLNSSILSNVQTKIYKTKKGLIDKKRRGELGGKYGKPKIRMESIACKKYVV